VAPCPHVDRLDVARCGAFAAVAGAAPTDLVPLRGPLADELWLPDGADVLRSAMRGRAMSFTSYKCIGYGTERCSNAATNPQDKPLWCDYHERKRRDRISADLKGLLRDFKALTRD